MKKLLCIILCIVLPLTALCGGYVSAASEQFEPDDTSVFSPVSQKGNLLLSYCADTGAVKLDNTASGESWCSAVTSDIFDASSSTDTFIAYMNSLIAVSYCKRNDSSGSYTKDYSSLMSNQQKAYLITNGIRLDYRFTIPNITISLEIALTDNGLRLCIPQKSIAEKGDYILYSAEVLPFFGTAAQSDEGYLFYPDGSGAVTEFADSMSKSRFTDEMVLDVFGTLDDNAQLTGESSGVMLPVYGIRRNGSAFLACADTRTENLSIHVSPCMPMSLLPVNRSYFEFKYRGRYAVYLSNSVKGGQDKDKLQYRLKLDTKMIKEDCKVSIILLDKNEADYSGMANVCREHLIKSGLLSDKRVSEKQKLSLDLFMAVKNPDSFFGKKIVATSFAQAQDIMKEYLDAGVEGLNVRLTGWSTDGGELPQSPRVTAQAGGNKGLKKLDAFAKKNSDRLSLLLQADTLTTSKKRTAALMGNLIPISDSEKETFLTTPLKAVSALEKLVSKVKKRTAVSISVQGMGQTVYNDYKQSRRLNRTETADEWSKALENKRIMAVQGGNLYALNKVSYLYDIPMQSSGNPLTDYSVPFYQMVVHGHIAYSAPCPGNLSSDTEREVLKWIEYGCIPYFLLTKENPVLLSGTSAERIFSSENKSWQKTVLGIYQGYSKDLSGLSALNIASHKRISAQMSAVTYENGTEIIINYGNSDAQYGGITVKAESYAVKGA